MKKTLVASWSIVLLCIAACGGGSSAAAGTYELDKAALKEAAMAAMPAEMRASKETAAAMDQMVNGMSVTVELKADGTASMRSKMDVMGQKVDESETGTWKLDGGKLSITAKNKDGKEETHTADYANGVITMEKEEGGQKMKLHLRRK